MDFTSRRQPRLTLLAAVSLLCLATAQADDEPKPDASAHLLAAELALENKDYLKAATEFLWAAEMSDSVEIAGRATEVARNFGFDEIALDAAERWYELDESSDRALFSLGLMELRNGDARAARKHFKTLIERGDDPPDQRLESLVPLLADEDPEEVDKLMRALAKPYKDSYYAHYAVAVTALSADDPEHAMERAERAIELEPDALRPKLLYGRAMLLSGQTDKAIDYTARIIGDDPDPDPDARIELAIMMMSAGRDDDALSQVNQVMLEQPSRTEALRLMAIINFRQQNLDAAWDDFQSLLASGRYTMDALYYLGRIADFRGQTDAAIEYYRNVTDGMNAVAAQRRASALLAFQKEAPEAAVERLDNFADVNASFAVDVVLAKAQLYAALDDYDNALTYYDKFVRFRPDSENGSLGRAELLLRMDRLDDAITEYRRAVKRWPESALSLNALGYTLADRTDRYIEAEKLIRKALKYDPDSPAIIDSLGWVLFKLGRNQEALVVLERAYEGLADPEVAAHIVEVLAALDRRDEALTFLETAEEQDPDSPLLKDVRERIFPASDEPE